MYIVIEVRDNQVTGVMSFKGNTAHADAINYGVKLVQEQGGTESVGALTQELLNVGQYTPSKHPEWSVAVVEVSEAE